MDALHVSLDKDLAVIYDSVSPFIVDELEDLFINEFNIIFSIFCWIKQIRVR